MCHHCATVSLAYGCLGDTLKIQIITVVFLPQTHNISLIMGKDQTVVLLSRGDILQTKHPISIPQSCHQKQGMSEKAFQTKGDQGDMTAQCVK